MSDLIESSKLESPKKMEGSFTRGRRRARVRAVQALYQWDLNPIAPLELVKEYFSGLHNMKNIDSDYFQTLVMGTIGEQKELDVCFTTHIQIELNLLDPIERCVLRLSTYELKHCLDVPKRVVINEGVDIAKSFGAVDGHKFVNSVLDKVARDLRQHEK